jgi:hypothetical protein
MMPPPIGAAGPESQFELAGLQPRRSNVGELFTVALLKAGRDGCTCEACRVLKRVSAELERALEAMPDAGQG